MSQIEKNSQIAVANKRSWATSTINAVKVENDATGLYSLKASLHGSIGAFVVNAADSQASDEGSEASEISSLNLSHNKN